MIACAALDSREMFAASLSKMLIVEQSRASFDVLIGGLAAHFIVHGIEINYVIRP